MVHCVELLVFSVKLCHAKSYAPQVIDLSKVYLPPRILLPDRIACTEDIDTVAHLAGQVTYLLVLLQAT